MKRFRFRQWLLLVALVLPSVAVAVFGWSNYKDTSSANTKTQGTARALIAQELLSRLDGIRDRIRVGDYSDPVVVLVASIPESGGPAALLWESDGYAPQFGLDMEKDSQFLRQLKEREWKPYRDSGLWLSSVSSANGKGRRLVIAVLGQELVQRVKAGHRANGNDIRFEVMVPLNDPEFTVGPLGVALGDNFPGFRITFPWNQYDYQQFYFRALALIASVTLLGGYLLLRDTLRELRVAEIRSQFVANVSHELKTPLTAIRMFAETLQMRGSLDPEVQKDFLGTIVNESERLTRLLNNVLDFSRIERGERNYRLEPAPLADVVRSAARTMQIPLSEQGFDFRIEICEEVPPMRLDRDALEQAVINLLSNAMKYSGQSREIILKVNSDKGSALIQVVDQGIGIAVQDQKRIFETFYRVASPENDAISGTGLGLALIAHIAKGHGGSVDVESKPGEGSTFSIRIPFNAEAYS